MKPDLLVCWIKHCDYPIFRRFLRRHRDFFGKIIIYWSEHFREYYFNESIEKDLESLPNIEFIQNVDYKYGVEDWRNVATNIMLKRTNSEWVCSVEQDFIVKDWDKLFSAIQEAAKTYSALGFRGFEGQNWHQDSYLSGHYIHPAFFFIKRSLLEETSKDFSADPSRGSDHFGLITHDLEKMKVPIWYTQEHGFPESEALHQGGINFNYLEGLKDGFQFHRPELFYIYNWWSMKAEVPQDPQFMDLMKKIDAKLKLQIPDINPETDPRANFFK